MRFSSQEHLATFKATGNFPAIHDSIFNLIVAEAEGNVFCDLGCHFGLLGQRLNGKFAGWKAVGIEADFEAIGLGLSCGVSIEMLHCKVDRESMIDACQFMKHHGVNVLVCRRILPEIFSHDLHSGETFAKWCRDIGIKQVFIEGRVRTANSVNVLDCVEKECAMFLLPFVLARQTGNLAHLRER